MQYAFNEKDQTEHGFVWSERHVPVGISCVCDDEAVGRAYFPRLFVFLVWKGKESRFAKASCEIRYHVERKMIYADWDKKEKR